ncbi:hypothetical protein TNCV_3388071 [Trichonephila clavipes]|nr:hypothetical protein TNCV_3388071 [Trichonephila clavipes]
MDGVIELQDRTLIPLKIHHIKGLIHVKSVQAQSPPNGWLSTRVTESTDPIDIHANPILSLNIDGCFIQVFAHHLQVVSTKQEKT